MKPHLENEYSQEKLKMFQYLPTQTDIEIGLDEWEVDKILQHRKNKQGKLEFLVLWKGYTDPTWEPLMNFIHWYSSDWRNYVAQHKLKFDLVDYMSESDEGSVSAILATMGCTIV